MNIITIIIIIVVISKIMKNAEKTSNRKGAAETVQNVWDQIAEQVESSMEAKNPAGTYQMPKHNVRTTPAYEQINMQSYQDEQAVKEQLERTKKRILESRGMSGTETRKQQNKSAMQQVHDSRMKAGRTSILERASENTDMNKEDITLRTLEAEHQHSERVSAAEHHHPEDIMPESMLGAIDDLMIKGYDGNLCFERDFLGEAMDMISHFTVPSDVPDFSKNDVA